MPAAYLIADPTSPQKASSLETSGGRSVTKLMLGATGAAAPGNSDWMFTRGLLWKTFILRPHNQAVVFPAGAIVRIEGCHELDPADKDANTKAVTLGTLNNTTKFLAIEAPFYYVRAVVENAGGAVIQVDVHAQGI